MLRRRLAITFIVMLSFAGIMLIVLAAFILTWLNNELQEIEIKRNFSPNGIIRLLEEATLDDQGRIVSSRLMTMLEQDGGWLQSLDSKGKVLQSFYAPSDLPTQYEPAELIDYWQGKKAFPYTLGLWIAPKDNQTFILLYGKSNTTEISLSPFIDDAKIINNEIILSPDSVQILESRQGWIQVFDSSGAEVASWHKPAQAPSSYTLEDLALRSTYFEEFGVILHSHYDEQSGLSWILQYKEDERLKVASIVPNARAEVVVSMIAIIILLLGTLVILVILAIGYAHFFVRPALDIVDSIQFIASGNYTNDSTSIKKRRRHLFKEMLDAIAMLGQALQESKRAEKQTQVYREEWIAGVTHDMKTPLSSIQGYAHMLAAEQYKWSDEEIHSFAAIILNKSQYIDQLTEDLALTYRLRNGKLPVSLEQHSIHELLLQIISKASSHPAYANTVISYKPPIEEVYGHVYQPWFERIIENIITNSVLHNKPGTSIQIKLLAMDTNKGWVLNIHDDGNGMDEETKQRLFERYYRGTNTDEAIVGSGLGMAITKELVQAMHGSIEVQSAQAQGTTIILRWFDQ